nr:unnamed protein product [Digitaria exilis]
MNEIRKIKRGISTKRGDNLVQNGQHPTGEWEEQQRYWPSPSPRAPPASPTESPRTPGGSQKKAVLGKVKSKAKKWMHMLHHKKKPAQEEMMWTPRAGPSAEDTKVKEERRDADYRGTPKKVQYLPSSSGNSDRASEVFLEASARQNSPVPSPTAHKDQTYFKVSSRFESEMKEANEMLMESKKLRVNTTKPKTVTFAPTIERELLGNEKSGSNDRELSEAATEVFRNAFATVYQVVLKMIAKIQDTMVAYNIDRRHMLEKLISVNRYLMMKLEPGEDDKVLSEVITDAILNLFDTWIENVEQPLVQRAKGISSWFLHEGREETPVPLSTHPCAFEGKIM